MILMMRWLQLPKLENLEGLTLNTFPRFGGLAMKMPRIPLMSPPKLPFKKMSNPGVHPLAGNPEVTGIPQVDYSSSQ